ncbi:ABC transporter permease [Microbispora rosea subsp. aerata]|nr:ABC transporter permease [Microbispora rosea]GGO22663.1 ABC transporter permease [Microbispora rosea subsp. aerata]GIH58251.1 ABC transporter permease [Microbispora rosea subsp. aerata]GLJ86917.1 ABC transporter permease [Microbispora rosea subsp. aerata]
MNGTLVRRAAVLLIAAVALAAVFAPVLAPYGPAAGDLHARLLPPGSPGHPLGTDGQGRDLLSRVIWGARISLAGGALPVAAALVLGTALGVPAGLGGPRVENLIMRVLDVLYAFPAVLLAMAVASALGPGFTSTTVSLSVVLTPAVARVALTEVRRIRSADYLEAARASGAGRLAVATRQVLPVVLPVVLTYCTALVGLAIVYAAGLSFFGLGVAPPTAEWGSMLNELRPYVFSAPGVAVVPAIVIFVVSLAFTVLDGAPGRAAR